MFRIKKIQTDRQLESFLVGLKDFLMMRRRKMMIKIESNQSGRVRRKKEE